MKLIVGLGNPGAQYVLTRHNIGFLAVETLAEQVGYPQNIFRSEFKAHILKISMGDEVVLLAKPQTYMNLSGDAVRPIMDFYKIELQNLLVLHDEVDQPFGQLRCHINRGHAGHNGIRHLHHVLQSSDYARLRLGVGRPHDPHVSVADYVLHPFSSSEQLELKAFLNLISEATQFWIMKGTQKTATFYNQQPQSMKK